MELRAVYKQTDVGMIPEDWEVTEAFNLNPFITSGSRGWAKYYSDRGDLFIRITNLSRQSIYPDLSDQKLVDLPKNDAEGLRTALRDGDVLISITADIGIIGYINETIPKPAYINQHISCLRLSPEKVDSRFQSYFLASHGSQKRFAEMTDVGAKSGINLTTVGKLKLLCPPLPEQRAIAAALSDADALIASLEGLIAKKRDLKQAVMQQLLTGQTRLPGFKGEWKTRRLGEIAEFYKGKGLPKSIISSSGKRPCIHYGDLFTLYGPLIDDIASRTNCEENVFTSRQNDVLMPTSDVTPNGLAKASCLKVDGVILGGDILIIRTPLDMLDGVFLASQIRFRDDKILKLVRGSTVYHLYASDMRKFECCIPPIEEQKAIVSIFSDFDADLAVLIVKRDKAHALKLGMMQELLMGRIRLI